MLVKERQTMKQELIEARERCSQHEDRARLQGYGGMGLPPPEKIEEIAKNTSFCFFLLYGRWEDLDRWKWVVIDVGVILDAFASHSENFV